MQAKQLEDGSERTFILVFQTGDEIAAELAEFAKAKRLASSHFTAIGALSDVTSGVKFNLQVLSLARQLGQTV